jgi:hypothetical protein
MAPTPKSKRDSFWLPGICGLMIGHGVRGRKRIRKMSFFETPERRLYIVRACGLFVLALAIGALSLAPNVDEQGRVFCYALSGLCGLMGLFSLWRARRSSPKATVTLIPERAPIRDQVRQVRRMLWLSVVAFPVMTAWIAYDLHRLESGTVRSVSIWAPLIPVYEHLGYWPTVLSLPVLGTICCAVFIYKLRRITRHDCGGNI